MTQNDTILRHLEQHGEITPLDALRLYGIMRLGARIYDLREKGYIIGRTLDRGTKSNGEPTHWARYVLLGKEM